MQAIYATFGKNVRDKRKKLNMSQEELAYRINRDVRSIIAIETGKRNPTLKTVYNLCKALQAKSSDLLAF